MDFKRFLKKVALLTAVSLMLFAGCDSNSGQQGTQSSDVSSSESGDAPQTDIAPSDVVKAILAQVSITSAVEKDQSELATYYGKLDTSKVESAAFCLCGSGAYPDEIAVIKFKSAADAKNGEEALKARIDSQSKIFKDYTPKEMYKLENSIVFSKGNYAVLLAVSDNEKAKSIADEKLAG